MAKNRELKVELINELSFLMGLQEKVWKYHPNNPNAHSIVDEFAQLQMDIDDIEKQLSKID
jgi:hypothetical protein|tara:strand:- start:1563 stop:1745 length:183 start_codon:yes stop_codon:yes gene_type:complete